MSKKLDLHGVKNMDAEEMIDLFIGRHFDKLPIEIITGNSVDMQRIVRKVVDSYKLKMVSSNYVNLGSYVISHESK